MASNARSFGNAARRFSGAGGLVSRACRTGSQPSSLQRSQGLAATRRIIGTAHLPRVAKPSCSNSPCLARPYFTASASPEAPYPPTEAAILSAATSHIPTHGFTTHTLTLGAIDAGYLPASINILPRGAFDLVLYHLTTCRLALKNSVQFPDADATERQQPPATTARVRSLLVSRLHANKHIIHKLPEALALMALPTNVPSCLHELALLVDEILYLAGDKDVSASWYTKRAALAGVYASSEMFMTQDQSEDLRDTEDFVDRRLEDSEKAAYAVGSVGQWLGFTGLSAINVLRSWGAKL